ncbi:MAG: Endoribonuclease YbeY [Polaribacter sejongensis]|mgnify:CR=1 FL=1|nr:MAG: Endoribonuclease YbeY [Polaribacter sejongensis]|tara:strand:- start:598 stop:1011 length:414 start_codon:yes stop_codon:yes gene_type:complete
MITFNYETSFQIDNESLLEDWVSAVVLAQGFELGDISYVFCDDDYLHKLNVEFLQHDTLTDIISFDTTLGKVISGDIFISVERVIDNALDYKVPFIEEFHRVLIHGVLHFMGYTDKSDADKKEMRIAEDKAILMISK